MVALKLELVEGKYKLSKKNHNTWNFMMLSKEELEQVAKLIKEQEADTTCNK